MAIKWKTKKCMLHKKSGVFETIISITTFYKVCNKHANKPLTKKLSILRTQDNDKTKVLKTEDQEGKKITLLK